MRTTPLPSTSKYYASGILTVLPYLPTLASFYCATIPADEKTIVHKVFEYGYFVTCTCFFVTSGIALTFGAQMLVYATITAAAMMAVHYYANSDDITANEAISHYVAATASRLSIIATTYAVKTPKTDLIFWSYAGLAILDSYYFAASASHEDYSDIAKTLDIVDSLLFYSLYFTPLFPHNAAKSKNIQRGPLQYKRLNSEIHFEAITKKLHEKKPQKSTQGYFYHWAALFAGASYKLYKAYYANNKLQGQGTALIDHIASNAIISASFMLLYPFFSKASLSLSCHFLTLLDFQKPIFTPNPDHFFSLCKVSTHATKSNSALLLCNFFREMQKSNFKNTSLATSKAITSTLHVSFIESKDSLHFKVFGNNAYYAIGWLKKAFLKKPQDGINVILSTAYTSLKNTLFGTKESVNIDIQRPFCIISPTEQCITSYNRTPPDFNKNKERQNMMHFDAQDQNDIGFEREILPGNITKSP